MRNPWVSRLATGMLAGLVFSVSTAAAQAPATLSVQQQLDDFAVFRGGVREGHAGRAFFIAPSRFERQCDSVQRTFAANAPVGSYYLKLRYLITLLGHGHTRLSLPTRNEEYRLGLLQPQQRYLPLELRILGGKLYALTDCSAEQMVPAGAEIVRVNGVPARQLLASMLKYIPADGRNLTFKYFNLTNYYNFHFLYSLLYPRATGFALELRGRPQPVRLQGQLPAAIARAYRARHPRGISYYGEQLSYQPALAPAVGYLKVGSFYKGLIERPGQHFEPFIDSVFRDVKARGTQQLLLDLRDNEGGGDGYSENLFAHLTAQPFAGGGPYQVPGRDFPMARYTRDLADEVKGYMANPREFLRDDSTLYLNKQYAELMGERVLPPAAQPYLGRLYVLINGGTFSAGNVLVRRLYQLRQATGQPIVFVGEENGGDVYSNVLCASPGYTVQLPNSQLTLEMPFVCDGQLNRRYPARRLPDFAVQPTIADVLAGRDAEVQFVLRQAGQVGQGPAK